MTIDSKFSIKRKESHDLQESSNTEQKKVSYNKEGIFSDSQTFKKTRLYHILAK